MKTRCRATVGSVIVKVGRRDRRTQSVSRGAARLVRSASGKDLSTAGC